MNKPNGKTNGNGHGHPSGDCVRCRALFSNAYDDEFAVGEREFFYAHVKACGACTVEFAVYQRALRALRDLQAAPASSGFEQRVAAAVAREGGHTAVVAFAREPVPTRPVPRFRSVSRPLAYLVSSAALIAVAVALVYATVRFAPLAEKWLAGRDAAPGHVRVGDRDVPADEFVAQLLAAQGYVRVGGRWVPREEAQALTEGRIWFAGRWLTPAELRAAVLKEEGAAPAGGAASAPAPAPATARAPAAPASPQAEDTLRALGYAQVGGRWVTAEEKSLIGRGYVFYDGRWVSPADIKKELLALEGLVFHDGRWMTADQRDRLLASAVIERRPDAPARNEVTAVLESLAIGEPVVADALAVYPLYAGAPATGVPFTSVDAALRDGKLEVKDEKNMRRLKVRNLGDRPVLLVAGDLLAGGTQDRLVARDTVLPPAKKAVDLAVYCAEPGRSTAKADRFDPVGAIAFPGIRRLAASDALQADVWAGIGRQLEALDVRSPTGALSAAWTDPVGRERLAAVLRRLGDVPARDDRTVGVVIGVDRDLAVAEVFTSNGLLREEYPKVLAAFSAPRRPAAAPAGGAAAAPNTKAGVKQLLEGAFYCTYLREPAEAGASFVIRAGNVVVGQAVLHEGRLGHAVLYPGAPEPPPADRAATYSLDAEKLKRIAAEFGRTMGAAGEAERLRAVQELCALRGDKVADRVAELLAQAAPTEPSDLVLVAVAEGLGVCGRPPAAQALADLLARPRRRPLVTKAAADALARTGDPRAVEPLFKLLHQGEVETARIGLDACVQLLLTLRDRPSLEKAMGRFIDYYEMLDLHAEPGHIPAGCITHGLYTGLYEAMHAALLRVTEFNYSSGARYRKWWNDNKQTFLRNRTGQ